MIRNFIWRLRLSSCLYKGMFIKRDTDSTIRSHTWCFRYTHRSALSHRTLHYHHHSPLQTSAGGHESWVVGRTKARLHWQLHSIFFFFTSTHCTEHIQFHVMPGKQILILYVEPSKIAADFFSLKWVCGLTLRGSKRYSCSWACRRSHAAVTTDSGSSHQEPRRSSPLHLQSRWSTSDPCV